MGGKQAQASNGTLNGHAYAAVGKVPISIPGGFYLIATIIKSAIPYLLFLFLYGINQQVHILPRFTDIDCVHLHNVSAWEDCIFHFSPHKVISSHSSQFLDILSTVPYLMHYVIPVLYPLFLYWKGQVEDICRFYWLLGWAMWIHYLIWFLLPTAPPWVYENWSRFARPNTTMPPFHLQHKEGCAFARVDALTGIPFFFNMFASNPVPFASFPSGHVSWPTCIYITSPPGGKAFMVYIMWVAWATMYSCHHYISDAISAVLLVVFTKWLLIYLSDRSVRTGLRETSCASCPAVVCPLNMV